MYKKLKPAFPLLLLFFIIMILIGVGLFNILFSKNPQLAHNKIKDGVLHLNPPSGTYVIGEPIVVQVLLDAPSQPTVGIKALLLFDPKRLSVQNIDERGSSYNLFLTKHFNNATGEIVIEAMNLSGVDKGKNILVATVHLTAITQEMAKISFAPASQINVSPTIEILGSARGATYMITISQIGRDITLLPRQLATVETLCRKTKDYSQFF